MSQPLQTIDRPALKRVKADVLKALEPVAERYDLSFDFGSGTFGATWAELKLSLALAQDGDVMTKEAQDFKASAAVFGLDPKLLFTEFQYKGRRYKITGLNKKARTYPIVTERDDGKGVTFMADHVQSLTS